MVPLVNLWHFQVGEYWFTQSSLDIKGGTFWARDEAVRSGRCAVLDAMRCNLSSASTRGTLL